MEVHDTLSVKLTRVLVKNFTSACIRSIFATLCHLVPLCARNHTYVWNCFL